MRLAGITTIPLHIGDFISGTMHMDATEKGAYIMLLLSHYQIGEDGLPNDDKKLSRIAGVSMKTWSRIKPTMEEKFCIAGCFWTHSRVIDTLQKVAQLSASQRAKALKKHNSHDATAQPRHSQPKPKPNIVSKDTIIPYGISELVWNDFKALRLKKKAPITETAMNRIISEAKKAGITLEEALTTCCQRGWTGFQAEWVNKQKGTTNAKSDIQRQLEEIEQNGW
jgi:uncharacterized protein YdaU (DUF1376 family)